MTDKKVEPKVQDPQAVAVADKAVAKAPLQAVANFDDIPDAPAGTLDVPPDQRIYAYWVNGDPKMKQVGGVAYLGGWAIDAGKIPADKLDPDIWNLEAMTTKEGAEYEVYVAPVVHAAVIGYRRSWITRDDPPRYVREFEKGARQYVELACVLKGVAEPNMTMSAKGYNAGNLLAAYTKAVNQLRAAIKSSSKPQYAWWLPFGGDVREDGSPVVTMVGSEEQSGITVIKPRFAGKPDLAWAQDARVPAEVLQYCMMNHATFLQTWKEERFVKAQTVPLDQAGYGDESEQPDVPFD